MPSAHAIAVLVLAVVVFYLYTRSWIAMELVSLLLLAALLVLFFLFPYSAGSIHLTHSEIFQVFGHPALIAICSLMILARGLTMTGALEPMVRALTRMWRFNRWLGLLVTLVVAAGVSGFVNDTPVLVLMLPMLLSLAQRVGFPAARTLMPVNFAILAGGMLTSIGTSTNLLVLSIATDLGMRPFGMLDFMPIAAASLAVAIPYLWLVAPRLLGRTETAAVPVERHYRASARVADDAARLLDQPLAALARRLGGHLPVTTVVRGAERLAADEQLRVAAGDVLELRDTTRGLQEFAATFDVELFDREGAGRFMEADAVGADLQLAEAVVGTDCPLVDQSLRQCRFAQSHGVVVIGIKLAAAELQRQGGELADIPLHAGDVLLIQGPVDRLEALRAIDDLLILDTAQDLPRKRLARIALLIMAAVIVAASTKFLPIHVAAFLGVIAMLLTGCVRTHGIGRALSLQVVLIVASSIALGQSLVATGAAGFIAAGVAAAIQHLPPAAQLAAFMVLAALLTNFVSNSAAASVGTPIAVATAQHLGSPLEPFVLAILFGANLSYATPMAYQTNLLVMNAAGYKFSDFLRVGVPLVILMLIVLSLMLVRHFGI